MAIRHCAIRGSSEQPIGLGVTPSVCYYSGSPLENWKDQEYEKEVLGNVWHHFYSSFKLQWKNRTFYKCRLCVSSSQYIYILYKFISSLFFFVVIVVFFSSAAKRPKPRRIGLNKEHKRPSSFQMAFLSGFTSEHWIYPHLFLFFFAIQNNTWKFHFFLFFSTLWHNFPGCFWGAATVQSQESSFPLRSHCQFRATRCLALSREPEILFDH